MAQPHGIPRSRFHPRPARLTGTPETDIAELDKAHGALGRRVDEDVNRLTKRINEMILSGTLAERPAAGTADRIFLVVTNHIPGPLYFDDGTQWILVGSPTSDAQRVVLAGGEGAHTFAVNQPTAVYMPAFAATWYTMVKITGQTPTALTVEFSNPPSGGDVLTVVIP